MNSLSMHSAIQKLIPMEKGQSINDYNKANATKIRRVYDVTNVLCSLNLIKKRSVSIYQFSTILNKVRLFDMNLFLIDIKEGGSRSGGFQ